MRPGWPGSQRSVASALAPSLTWLILAQMAQGVGWSMCVGSGAALLVRDFPASQ